MKCTCLQVWSRSLNLGLICKTRKFGPLWANSFVSLPNGSELSVESSVIRPPHRARHLCAKGPSLRMLSRSAACESNDWGSGLAGAFGVGDSVLKATHAQFSLLVSCCSFWHLCPQAGDCVSLEAEVQAASSKLRCGPLANLGIWEGRLLRVQQALGDSAYHPVITIRESLPLRPLAMTEQNNIALQKLRQAGLCVGSGALGEFHL